MASITALPALASAQTASGQKMVPIPSTRPFTSLPGTRMAPGLAVPTGSVAEVHIMMGNDQAGLAALAESVSNPASRSYGRWLTPARVRARYGATSSELAATKRWLVSRGLRVTDQDPFVVSAEGSVAHVAKAFSTRLETAPQGQITNATGMSAPAAVASHVVTVMVTSTRPVRDVPRLARSSLVARAAAGAGSRCSAYWDQKRAPVPDAYGHTIYWAPCGYTSEQMRSALSAKASGFTGRGVTVGIVSGDNDSTALADANKLARKEGFPPFRTGQFTAYVNRGALPGTGDVESALDVEAVHSVAPGANVAYVPGGSGALGEPTLNALEDIVDNGLAQVVTDSWGLNQFTRAKLAAFTNVLQRAAVEGITVNTASGDVGPTTDLSYLFPASDPWLTTLGGTSLAIGSRGRSEWQMGWEDTLTNLAHGTWSPNPPGPFAFGSTGGISTLFKEPYYQRGVVSRNVVDGKHMEAYPDFSDVADPYTGFLVGESASNTGPYEEFPVGGTSEASPLFAATEADAIQARHGILLGFANPLLYSLAGSQAISDVTCDPLGKGVTEAVALPAANGSPVQLGTLGQVRATKTLFCGPGYDTVSGVGTPSSRFIATLEHR